MIYLSVPPLLLLLPMYVSLQCIKEELRELHSKETLGRTQKRNYLS